jgi:hypothetical protein
MSIHVWFVDEAGISCHRKRATHCVVIYEHVSAKLEDARNLSRSYIMVAL